MSFIETLSFVLCKTNIMKIPSILCCIVRHWHRQHIGTGIGIDIHLWVGNGAFLCSVQTKTINRNWYANRLLYAGLRLFV